MRPVVTAGAAPTVSMTRGAIRSRTTGTDGVIGTARSSTIVR
jgi:hypothetical protein